MVQAKEDKPKKEKDFVKLGRRLSARLFSPKKEKKDPLAAEGDKAASSAEAPKIETPVDESKLGAEGDKPAEVRGRDQVSALDRLLMVLCRDLYNTGASGAGDDCARGYACRRGQGVIRSPHDDNLCIPPIPFSQLASPSYVYLLA